MKWTFEPNKQPRQVNLPAVGGGPKRVHLFDQPMIDAVEAAVAARRPLLVRGEPGTGKSQLARAAAKALGWAYIRHTVDARCEPGELCYSSDAVARLARAQVLGALGKQAQDVETELDPAKFVRPGPLWWLFHWESAAERKGRTQTPANPDGGNEESGRLLLLDEIDKADPDLPNSLLEVFGEGRFQVTETGELITRQDMPLLVMITTNEERALPNAFLRRCLVLHLSTTGGARRVDSDAENQGPGPCAGIGRGRLDQSSGPVGRATGILPAQGMGAARSGRVSRSFTGSGRVGNR